MTQSPLLLWKIKVTSTEEEFALPTQPSRVWFAADSTDWTAKIEKKMKSNRRHELNQSESGHKTLLLFNWLVSKQRRPINDPYIKHIWEAKHHCLVMLSKKLSFKEFKRRSGIRTWVLYVLRPDAASWAAIIAHTHRDRCIIIERACMLSLHNALTWKRV